MKVTYNWLKDFVEINIPARILAEKLTMAGLEVVSLKEESGDFVFEIEITSNRPDWLSVIGIAREVSAITAKKFKLPKISPSRIPRATAREQFSLKIEDKKDCPLYTARIIRGVRVGPSPGWLAQRLELVGCRSVNNIVDITNYALFEWGEPLHAFDLDTLSDSGIIIRRAKDKERIVTIDGQERVLTADILVIADVKKPVAVAGVMGGEATEVSGNSKNILLEAAIFNPALIRRSRQKLGMQSEAAYRFERGVSVEAVGNASLRAAQLIQAHGAGQCVLTRSLGSTKPKAKSLLLNTREVEKNSGMRMPQPAIKKILVSLGFSPRSRGKDKFLIKVPFWREDVNSGIDLIEELTRIYGYSRLPTSLPRVSPQASHDKTRDLVSLVKNTLLGLGLNEVITHSLISKELLKEFGGGYPLPVEIQNPLNKEQEILRPTLLSSLARCVGYNLNQRQTYVNIFEVAKVFKTNPSGLPNEELFLGIALCGERPLFLNKGMVKEEASPLHLKGIAEALFKRLGISNYRLFQIAPNETVIYLGQKKLGSITALTREALGCMGIKNKEVFMLEFSLENLYEFVQQEKKFKPLPKYPGIVRDISFIFKEDIATKDILKAIEENGRPLLQSVEITDYYKGKQIPDGSRSLTVSCLYRCAERTLTESEVNPLHLKVCLELKDRFGVGLR
jgi:phenylalanyl-tRNA synthetase beta chain